MPYTYRRAMTEKESYEIGKELFELWISLGTLSKANLEFQRRHPEEPSCSGVVVMRRTKTWWVLNTEEGMQIFKKYKPNTPDFILHQRLIEYTIGVIRSTKNFKEWLEKNPWAKDYEYVYSQYYDL